MLWFEFRHKSFVKTALALDETWVQGAIIVGRTRGFAFIKHPWSNEIPVIRFNCSNHRSIAKDLVQS